ncbi:MAG: hypothetical protein ACLFSV_01265 [Alkalispirochaeta sp.]
MACASFPSPRGNRVVSMTRRIGQAVATVVLLGTVFSCATVPSRVTEGPETVDGGRTGISREDRTFLETVRILSSLNTGRGEAANAARSDEPGWELFISFSSWPRGRDVLNELLSERYEHDSERSGAERGIRRVDAGYMTANRAGEIGWISVDISRFAGSIALNSAGWRWIRWGVWTDPEAGTTVEFLPDRVWELRPQMYPDADGTGSPPDITAEAATGERLPPEHDSPGDLLADLLDPPPTRHPDEPSYDGPPIGLVARIYRPTIPGAPSAILPQVVELLVRSDDTGSLRFVFPGERAARIALVPFRLQGRRVIEGYGFLGTEDFDIIRFDNTVVIRGITLERLRLPESVPGDDR